MRASSPAKVAKVRATECTAIRRVSKVAVTFRGTGSCPLPRLWSRQGRVPSVHVLGVAVTAAFLAGLLAQAAGGEIHSLESRGTGLVVVIEVDGLPFRVQLDAMPERREVPR